MAYKLLHHEHNAAGFNVDLHINITVKKNYQMVKTYKMHRCALDFDLRFFNIVVKNKDATSRGHLFILVYITRTLELIESSSDVQY